MIEILQFIFSSFWVWAGTVFLISSVAGLVASVWKGAVVRSGYKVIEPQIRATIAAAIRDAHQPPTFENKQ